MRVSLVTITFNAANTLPPTLDSVAMQHHDDVEHIIVDGASSDGTADLARHYADLMEKADNGHEVIVVSEPDKGLYDAMNKGLRLVTGEYVCFLNAGDRLPDADTLSRIVETAEMGGDGNKPGVVYGDTDLIDAEGRFIGHRRHIVPDKLTWRSFRKGMLVCHQAFYARTDLAKQVEYDIRYRYSADVDWCIRVMRLAEQQKVPLSRVSGVVALYLKEGMTTQHHKESLKERFAVMRHHYGLLTTLVMHAWFFIRAGWRKMSSSKHSG